MFGNQTVLILFCSQEVLRDRPRDANATVHPRQLERHMPFDLLSDPIRASQDGVRGCVAAMWKLPNLGLRSPEIVHLKF